MDWRIIPSLPWYEISEYGDIRRIVDSPTRKIGHPVKGHIDDQGYHIVHIPVGDGKKKMRKVHQLVAEAFLGPRPPGHQVAHYDGVRHHNHHSNLRWATIKENSADCVRHGTLAGSKNPRAKLTEELVRQIRAEYTGEHGQVSALARKYDLARSAMNDLIHQRHWKNA